jgi:hypothetical protein
MPSSFRQVIYGSKNWCFASGGSDAYGSLLLGCRTNYYAPPR